MAKLDIIYRDDDIIAVNKVAGMLSIPDRYDRKKDNVQKILEKKYSKIFTIQLIDRETSGIILFAFNKQSHASICQSLEAREATKTYWALSSCPDHDRGIISAPISESKSKKKKQIIHEHGKFAETHYKVLEKFGPYALLELSLITGRTHQIRVHLQHLNAPLMVDSMYGLTEAFYLSDIKRLKKRKQKDEKPLIKRTSLHARTISFIHPRTSTPIELKAPLPKDFKASINQLRKAFS